MKEESVLDYKLEEGALEFDYLDDEEDLEETKEIDLDEIEKAICEENE